MIGGSCSLGVLSAIAAGADYDQRYALIKEEKMPDGRTKLILKDRESGQIVQRIEG